MRTVIAATLGLLAACSVDAPHYVALDAQGAVVDATEGDPDAGVPAFDVAFPSEWRFSVQGPIGGYLMVINRGVVPLSMSSLHVQSVEDDHPTAFVRIMGEPFSTSVPPGQAGGHLTLLAESILVDSGIVTEARADVDSDYLSLEVVNAPTGTYDIAVNLLLGLDSLDVPMAMTIHVVPGPVIYADPELGTRITINR